MTTNTNDVQTQQMPQWMRDAVSQIGRLCTDIKHKEKGEGFVVTLDFDKALAEKIILRAQPTTPPVHAETLRLDWLEKQPSEALCMMYDRSWEKGEGETLRAAIDAAMKGGK